MATNMDVLTFGVEPEMTVEARLRLKDRIADAYRDATETTAEIGVDYFAIRRRGSDR